MKKNRTLLKSLVLLALAAPGLPAYAAQNDADAHAFFELQRTRTDGQVDGTPLSAAANAGSARQAVPSVRPSAQDLWWEAQRSRTDGNHEASGPMPDSRSETDIFAGLRRWLR